MPNLVYLAQKLPTWSIPRMLSVPLPPPARAPYTAQRRLPQWHMPTFKCQQSKFEPRVTKQLISNLERISRGANYVQVPCTCNVHLLAGFIQRRYALVTVYCYAEFVVPS